MFFPGNSSISERLGIEKLVVLECEVAWFSAISGAEFFWHRRIGTPESKPTSPKGNNWFAQISNSFKEKRMKIFYFPDWWKLIWSKNGIGVAPLTFDQQGTRKWSSCDLWWWWFFLSGTGWMDGWKSFNAPSLCGANNLEGPTNSKVKNNPIITAKSIHKVASLK